MRYSLIWKMNKKLMQTRRQCYNIPVRLPDGSREAQGRCWSGNNTRELCCIWKYGHCFPLVEIKDKNDVVSCQLCAGVKNLSTLKTSNSNLMKHLLKQHASTKLVAKDLSPTNAEGTTPCNQTTTTKAGFYINCSAADKPGRAEWIDC